MSDWLLIVIVVGAVSYLFRVSMLVVASRTTIPPVIERAARFAVPTAFAALAATALARQVTGDAGSLAPVVAVITAVIAVRRTGSAQAALLTGMPTLWLVSAFGHWVR